MKPQSLSFDWFLHESQRREIWGSTDEGTHVSMEFFGQVFHLISHYEWNQWDSFRISRWRLIYIITREKL